MSTGIDIDAIYNGDSEAIGDAIRLLTQAVSNTHGVLPVLTDKIIIPTFASPGLRIESEDGELIATLGSDSVVGGTPAPTSSTFRTDVNFLNRLRLGEVVDIANGYSAGDFQFSSAVPGSYDAGGAGHTLYRISPTSSKAINGIYKTLPETAQNYQTGQLVIIWNDSTFNIPFATTPASGVSAYQGIIGPSFYIGPQGVAVFVYDTEYVWSLAQGGWRCIATHNEAPWIAYTPTFTGSSSNPSTYTASGRYRLYRNGHVRVEASVICGTGFSGGSGEYSIGLPVTTGAVANFVAVRGAGVVYDSSASPDRLPVTVVQSTTTAVQLLPHTGALTNPVGAASPFTFADGDQIGLECSITRA